MTGSKLFIDTVPVIYLVEENPKYFKRVSGFLAESLRQSKILVTSVLTTAEFEIKPRKLNQPEAIDKFERILKPYFLIDNITCFVTNDRRLKMIKEVPIILIKDL